MNEPTRRHQLVRFRADPALVRVSLRHEGGKWVATVRDRSSYWKVSALRDDPRIAVLAALSDAAGHSMKGIDLCLEWAYEHPWKTNVDDRNEEKR